MTDENLALARDPGFSKKRKAMFLRVLGETGRVRYAATMAGWADVGIVYYHRKHDPEFKAAWAEAMERAGDAFEEEAARRGRDGVLKDVYYKGEVCGQERVYSDGLLSKLMDGAKPDKYQKRTTEHTGEINVKGTFGIAIIPAQAPSLEDWERQVRESTPMLIEGEATEILATPEAQRPPMKIVRA